MNAAFVFPLVFLALAVQSGESIKCYRCNSRDDPKCADPFKMGDDSKLLTECTPNIARKAADVFNSASKKLTDFISNIGINTGDNNAPKIDLEFFCAKVDFTKGDETWTLRECAPPKTDDPEFCQELMNMSKKDGIQVTSCQICDKDSCNGANSIQTAFYAMLLPLVAILLAQLR